MEKSIYSKCVINYFTRKITLEKFVEKTNQAIMMKCYSLIKSSRFDIKGHYKGLAKLVTFVLHPINSLLNRKLAHIFGAIVP